jgi:hypothetical protein
MPCAPGRPGDSPNEAGCCPIIGRSINSWAPVSRALRALPGPSFHNGILSLECGSDLVVLLGTLNTGMPTHLAGLSFSSANRTLTGEHSDCIGLLEWLSAAAGTETTACPRQPARRSVPVGDSRPSRDPGRDLRAS